MLYYFAKLNYRQGPYLDVAIEQLKSEPKLPLLLASRNFWNLYALNYKSETALNMFTEVYRSTKMENLDDISIANALVAFAHFQYIDFDCMEVLLKASIQRASGMKLATLALVVNAFAQLEVHNPTLLQITRQVLLTSIDRKAEIVDPAMI